MAGRIRINRRGGGGSELSETFRMINQRYGDGTVHKGSEIIQPHRIPTGVFILDFALLGGIPHNRITMVVGERHSGKSSIASMIAGSAQRMYPNQQVVVIDVEGCMAWDSELLDLDTGYVYTAEQVFRRKRQIRVASFDEARGRIVPMPITAWFDNGIKNVFEVSTMNTSIKVTDNHRFLVYRGAGQHEWVRCDQLQPGMLICRPRRMTWDWPAAGEITSDEARLLGYLIGDGAIGYGGSPVFTNTDPAAIQDVIRLCQKMDVGVLRMDDRHYRIACSLDGSKYTKSNTNPVIDLLRDTQLWGKTCQTKFIPRQVMRGSVDIVAECLSGLYMTDGSIHPQRPTLSFTSTSRELAVQVRHLWSRFGIIARIQRYTDGVPTHAVWYTVNINGYDQFCCAAEILRLVGNKQRRLMTWAEKAVTAAAKKPIGTYLPWQPPGAEKRENPFDVYWEEVMDVIPQGQAQTYDFTVDGTHNLVVNDIVVHNTFESNWAARLGADIDRLNIIPTESGEMAVDVTDAIMRSRESSLLIIDSVAALTPMKEQEASAEDSLVGMQARLVGSMIRKVSSGLIMERKRGHYVTVLLLNQFRSRIGGYGDPRVIPGGRALEFATTVQFEMKNKESIGRDERDVEEVEYNDHSFTIKKNKLNGGPRSGEFKLMRITDRERCLDVGDIDDAMTLLAYARKLGVYDGGGSHWTLQFEGVNGTPYNLKFKGREAACVYLYENRDVYWDLRCRLIRMQAEFYGMPEAFVRSIV